MGNFFKALEQAEREHALKEHARKRAASGEAPQAAPTAHREAPPAPPAPPAPVAPKAPAAPTVFQRPVVKEIAPAAAPTAPAPARLVMETATTVEEHLVSLLSPTSFGAEQYHMLRHRMEQLHATSNLSIVGVTSPEAGDGKTLTAINLAGALAQATDTRVLIVDADLRLSTMGDYLGLNGSRSRGLVGAILDPDASLKSVVETCPPFNLSVVRAGRRPTSPYELLKSPRLGQLMEEARRSYDYVVVDMPPLLPLLDSRVIGQWVDGFFVVVGANKTPRKQVGEALKLLDPATVIGLIFNGDDRTPTSSYYHRVTTPERSKWFGRRGRRNSSDGSN